VINFDTGFHAALLSLIHGWQDGYIDFVNTPKIAYERHGKLGGVAGTLVAVANGILKPVVGTLSSLTWLCRGIYANMNNDALVDKGSEAHAVNTLGLDSSSSSTSQQPYNDNIEQASKVAGISTEACQQILFEFDNIKSQRANSRSRRHKTN
jgi:hypothetical protein